MLSYDENVFLMLGGKEKYLESLAQLVEFAAIRPQDSVLEICCGTGLSTQKILAKTQNVVAVELNRERMGIAKERLPTSVPLLTKNALDLNVEDGRYDVIICINGFHYFKEDQFYALAHRMLAENGRLIFNVKLHDYDGVRPMHTYMPSVVDRITSEMLQLGPPRDTIDTSFIDSAHMQDTFAVPALFRMSRSQAYTLHYDPLVLHWYVQYLRHLAADLTSNELFVTGWGGHQTSLAFWTYDQFTQRIYHHISTKVPEEKRLAKAELFVEAAKL